jgi:acetylornithine deacetylase/succinyl-diaminopimelate desuccinylase-like protein
MRSITYQLKAPGKSGHTAIPQADNAIYTLAAALTRLAAFKFPIEFDDTTRAFLARTASTETGQARAEMIAASNLLADLAAAERLIANAERNAHLRTTYVATMLQAGTVENALADNAEATIQCRVLPQDTPEFVKASLVKAVADPSVSVTTTEPGHDNPESSLRPQLLSIIEAAVYSMWPEVLLCRRSTAVRPTRSTRELPASQPMVSARSFTTWMTTGRMRTTSASAS